MSEIAGSEPHETQEKLIKQILHVMFSAGQYRSTENLVSENIIFSNLNLTEFIYLFSFYPF